MKRTASALALAATVLLVPVVASGTASAAPLYSNCQAAFAAGVHDIHRGEAGYRPALDRDHDGVACESGDPAAANGGVGSGTHDVAATSPSTGSGSSSSSDGSTSSTGSAGSSGDQVAVVPQGGAETGDGSTAGHPGAWIGGALLAAFAGAAAMVGARRGRSAVRR